MNITITTNQKLAGFKRFLFVLTNLDSKKMFWFWFSVLFCEQLLSAGVEIALTGHRFTHIGDAIAFVTVAACYVHYQHELGKFLLNLVLHAEVKKDGE